VAEAAAMRARALERMETSLAASMAARSRSHRRAPWTVFAVAASLPVLVWGAVHVLGRDGGRHAGVATVIDVEGRAVIQGDELSTGANDRARAELPTGAVVDVAASSRARFALASSGGDPGDVVELGAGHIQVSVPKLGPGRRFRVHTPEATVIVHGTRFVVEASPGETRVSVLEGVVEVDTPAEVRMLTAGASFVVSDAQRDTPSPVPTTGSPPASPGSPSPVEPPTSARTDKTSTLASENALLAEAMRLRREKQDDRALAKLDELLARHAGSPLAETARVERMRALKATGDRERLVREAQAYLVDYPNGFARPEVTRLLGAGPTRDP